MSPMTPPEPIDLSAFGWTPTYAADGSVLRWKHGSGALCGGPLLRGDQPGRCWACADPTKLPTFHGSLALAAAAALGYEIFELTEAGRRRPVWGWRLPGDTQIEAGYATAEAAALAALQHAHDRATRAQREAVKCDASDCPASCAPREKIDPDYWLIGATQDEVNAELRALGLDPDAVAAEGERVAREALAERARPEQPSAPAQRIDTATPSRTDAPGYRNVRMVTPVTTPSATGTVRVTHDTTSTPAPDVPAEQPVGGGATRHSRRVEPIAQQTRAITRLARLLDVANLTEDFTEVERDRIREHVCGLCRDVDELASEVCRLRALLAKDKESSDA